MNYYRVFVIEFRKALMLYSKVFFGTILVSVFAFYIYGAIKENRIAQNVVLTVFAYLLATLFGIFSAQLFFRDFYTLVISLYEKIKHMRDVTYLKRMEVLRAEKLEIEIQQFNRVLNESLTVVQILRERRFEPRMLKELDRVKHELAEYIDPSPGVIYTLCAKLFRWKQPQHSQMPKEAYRPGGAP